MQHAEEAAPKAEAERHRALRLVHQRSIIELQALERTGLTADESQAMVKTWTKSYFKSEGLRLLYVVPRAWTDGLLPTC